MKSGFSKHISTGELRAYQDGELEGSMLDLVRSHLAGCARCRGQAENLSERASFVRDQIQVLSPVDDPLPAGVARARLDAYISHKEEQSMLQKIFSRSSRIVWAAVVLLIIVINVLAFPQLRAIATDFLGLFRVEKVAVIPFNPSSIPEEVASAGPRIEMLISDSFHIEEFGEVREVGATADASALAGIPVRLPTELGDPSVLAVQPGARVTFTIDLPRIRAILKEMGNEDIRLPDFIHGQTVTADLPPSVSAMYGDCQTDLEAARAAGHGPDDPSTWSSECMVLVQLASPTVSAPPGLDIDRLGVAFLELTGMSPEEAHRFSQSVDWATTLIVPVPIYASNTEVIVDGVQGVLVQQPDRWNRPGFMLAWVKDGVVYTLSGRAPSEEALRIADSLK